MSADSLVFLQEISKRELHWMDMNTPVTLGCFVSVLENNLLLPKVQTRRGADRDLCGENCSVGKTREPAYHGFIQHTSIYRDACHVTDTPTGVRTLPVTSHLNLIRIFLGGYANRSWRGRAGFGVYLPRAPRSPLLYARASSSRLSSHIMTNDSSRYQDL